MLLLSILSLELSHQKGGSEIVQLELKIHLSVSHSHHMCNFTIIYSTFLALAKMLSADVGAAVRRRAQPKILMVLRLSHHHQLTAVTKYMPKCSFYP